MYYVYAYLNQKTGKPYYIGKGQGDRIHSKHLNLTLPPDRKNRVILQNNINDEEEAYNIEKKLIEQYGRKDIGTGILLNKTAGGDGGDTSPSRKYLPMSDETKRKLSKKLKGKTPWNKGLKGIAHISPGNRKPKDAEHRRKISESLKGKRKGVALKKAKCPHCSLIGGGNSMKRWHFNNCKMRRG